MGIVRFLSIRIVEVAAVLLLILFMPNIPPNVKFTHFKVTPPQELEGKLALNNRLNGVERLHENELKGPEAFAEYNGEIYTSLHSGEVVKLSKGHIVPVVKFGKPCTGFIDESVCGRPLGLQFDKNGNLYVADAYMGIWKVNIKTGQKTLLVSMDTVIEGKKPKIPNSLALSSNGDFYWTDSSSDFILEDGVFSMFADGSGRVIHYNARTQTNKVLMDGLHFANGIILADNEEFIVISESARSRLYRFWLKGPKKGTHDIFADGLPGLPDNLNSDGKDGFFVPLIVAADSANPVFTQVIGPFPWIRKLMSRILALVELGFKTIDKIYPNFYTKTASHWVGHFESISILTPGRTTILHLSKSGEIIESLHTVEKSVSSISEAFIFGDQLYLGSPYNTYIGRISLKKAGLEKYEKKLGDPVKQTTVPPTTTTTPRPTTTTPRPTTTTPRPTTTTPRPTTTTPRPTTTTSRPTTTTPRPTTTTPPPTKQQKPTQAPIKVTTEKPVKAATQSATPQAKSASSSEQTPPTKQGTKPPVQQASSTATPKQSTQNKEAEKDTPQVIPVKDKSVPKTESIKSKK